jgi:hypothetical protein
MLSLLYTKMRSGLAPTHIPLVPEATAAAMQAACPKDNLCRGCGAASLQFAADVALEEELIDWV